MPYSSNKLLLIGGIPSSGSTRLVKILSESSKFLCLPETGLFTKGYQLNRNRAYIYGHVHSEVNWIDVLAKVQQSLGISLSETEFQNENFCPKKHIIDYFFPATMGKVVVEKTPENIFAFDYYLSSSIDNKVIVTTRDVRGICASLLKRGLSFWDALLLWYSHAYEAWHLMQKYPKQVLHLPYHLIVNQAKLIPDKVRIFLKLNNLECDKVISNYKKTLQEKEIEFSFNMSAKTLETRSWDSRIQDASRCCLPEFDVGLANESLINSFAFAAIDQSKPMSIMQLENLMKGKYISTDSKLEYKRYCYANESTTRIIEQLRENYKLYFKCYR